MSSCAGEKRKSFTDSLKNLFDLGKMCLPRNKEQRTAWRYLQEQRGRANLETENEPGITETVSCSDFEEEQIDNQTEAVDVTTRKTNRSLKNGTS